MLRNILGFDFHAVPYAPLSVQAATTWTGLASLKSSEAGSYHEHSLADCINFHSSHYTFLLRLYRPVVESPKCEEPDCGHSFLRV